MGLDGVEIVTKVEDLFRITIEDAEVATTATPGQLIDLVLTKVGRGADAACLTQRAFHRLRAALMLRLGVPRNQIRLNASLETLFPRATRKEDVRQIAGEIGLGKEIELCRPAWLARTLFTIIFSGGLAIAILALAPLAIVAALVFVVAFGWLAVLATRPMRTEFPSDVATAGQLSRWIAVNAPDVVKALPGPWSRAQVAEIVRAIVVDQLGCEQAYREDAHFVKDLGMA